MKLHINPDTKHIINYVQDTPDGGVIAQAGNEYIYLSSDELAKYIPVDNHFAKKVEPVEDYTDWEKYVKQLAPVIGDNTIRAYLPKDDSFTESKVIECLAKKGYSNTGKQPALDFKQTILIFKKVKK